MSSGGVTCGRCCSRRREVGSFNGAEWMASYVDDAPNVWVCPTCQTTAERRASVTLKQPRGKWPDTRRAVLWALAGFGLVMLAMLLFDGDDSPDYVEGIGRVSVYVFLAGVIYVCVIAFRDWLFTRAIAERRAQNAEQE